MLPHTCLRNNDRCWGLGVSGMELLLWCVAQGELHGFRVGWGARGLRCLREVGGWRLERLERLRLVTIVAGYLCAATLAFEAQLAAVQSLGGGVSR